MTAWRATLRCAPPCDTCTHALVEPQPGADNLLCREPRALAAFERPRVAAGLVRDQMCRARWHPEYRA